MLHKGTVNQGFSDSKQSFWGCLIQVCACFFYLVISSNIVEKYFFNHDPGNFPLMDGQNVFGFLFVICRGKNGKHDYNKTDNRKGGSNYTKCAKRAEVLK